VRDRAGEVELAASVCTGSFIYGAAGLLDGRRATTHWQSLDRMVQTYPAIEVVRDEHASKTARLSRRRALRRASTWRCGSSHASTERPSAARPPDTWSIPIRRRMRGGFDGSLSRQDVRDRDPAALEPVDRDRNVPATPEGVPGPVALRARFGVDLDLMVNQVDDPVLPKCRRGRRRATSSPGLEPETNPPPR
jgi:hypothetical protein